MRKLFFTIPVVLALLVSAVFSVQTAAAVAPAPTATVSWICIAGGAQLNWSGATAGETWHLHHPAAPGGVDVVLASASGSTDYLNGDGTYRIHDLNFGESRPPATIVVPGGCTTTTPVVAPVPVPPPPFWANDPKGAQRIDPDPGEKFAVYCYPGGYVDIWDTSGKQTKEFATTTYFALSKIVPGTTGTLTNDLTGGTFTASMDITGKFVTVISDDGKYSKTITLDKCLTWVNYKEDPRINSPLVPSYTVNTSAVITNQLNAAKARLASAVGAAAIAQAQADVARWESMYRTNNTVITEHADGSITFLFIDGTMITVAKDGTVK